MLAWPINFSLFDVEWMALAADLSLLCRDAIMEGATQL
jgi:hypothetical protein